MKVLGYHYAAVTPSQISLDQSVKFLYNSASPSNRHAYIKRYLHTHTPSNPTLGTLEHPPNRYLSVCLKCKSPEIEVCINTHAGCNGISDLGHKKIHEVNQEKSFWAAVSLIIGTAVGPGMLGLPAATIKSGPFPSILAIILSWIYVISSIILVAELSFAVMEEDKVAEVSFTGLARKALGDYFGSFVALVYASLSFSLLVACVAGIGSIISQWLPRINPLIANALFPTIIGIMLGLFPFNAIDAANRLLCLIMLFSITALVAIGLFVGRTDILGSFTYSSWGLSSVLPAIPVAVLTLGFHVITPFICKLAGNNVMEARRAILVGGFIPLVMVLSWNLIVLGLAGKSSPSSSRDPISLLLSVNSSALSAVQGFAFSALATSLIGYAVSFPKQILDTLDLISGMSSSKQISHQTQLASISSRAGKVGFVTFAFRHDAGNTGITSFGKSRCSPWEVRPVSHLNALPHIVTPLVLGSPVLIASFFPSTFSRALDFAGIYANCFLFGILPPVMTFIFQSRSKLRYVKNIFSFNRKKRKVSQYKVLTHYSLHDVLAFFRCPSWSVHRHDVSQSVTP